MASLRRKPANAAAVADTPPSSFSSSEIPLSGTATETPSDGVKILRDGMSALKRAQELHSEPDVATLEDRRRQWLASNEAARSNYSHLGELHRQALASGLTDMSPGYLDFMNQQVAALAAQTPTAGAQNRLAARETREQPQRDEPDRSAIVSAPVSRQVPSGYGGYRPSGQVRLTPDQREAAKIAGIDERTYAEQLERLLIAKSNGDYLGQP